MTGRRLFAQFLTGLPLFYSGCTPTIMPSGPEIQDPELSTRNFIMQDGAKLPYFSWLPTSRPQSIIIGLHGFGDYSFNAFDTSAVLFTMGDVAIYAYDQRGFGAAPNRGLWPGVSTLTADCAAVVTLIAKKHPGVPIFIMGESMGAAIALVLSENVPDLPVTGYILSAPGVRGRASMSDFSRAALEVAARLIPAVGFSGSAPGFAPSDNEDALRRWARDPLTAKEFRVDLVYGLVELMDQALEAASHFTDQALILYGARDRIVPADPLRRLLRTMPSSLDRRVAYYRQGYHLLLRDRERGLVVNDILSWMGNPRAPLPSGADDAAAEWLGPGDALR